MIFTKTAVSGALVIELEKREDNRGFFARAWCRNEFRANGLATSFAQCNLSFNHVKGTLRGLHYQAAPFEEAKLVRCIAGVIWSEITGGCGSGHSIANAGSFHRTPRPASGT